ncbi:hypothetical protein CAL7716_007670 [Calothrix sp. PCC 7716]|nr:hypothetical protein CAL7716_007670 [Calothrix sp. PCC 7716]
MKQPTSEQFRATYTISSWLTKMYLPIYLVTFDQRNDRVVIIAGEQTVITIKKQGELIYEQP